MFSNFKDTFIRKPQFRSEPPQAVLDTISRKLPEGFRYVHDHDGFCRIHSDEFSIGSAHVRLSEKAKPLFPDGKYTERDIMDYCYNAQEIIEFVPDEDGCFTVNGQKIPLSDFVTAPLKGKMMVDGKLYLQPPAFPEPFSITLSGDNRSIDVVVQRQAINSRTAIKFESVGDSPLHVLYVIEQISDKIDFNITLSLRAVKSAKDTLMAKLIYNDILSGKGYIAGSPLYLKENFNDKLVPVETIEFWRKVVALEEFFSVETDAKTELTIDGLKNIDALYRCFIEKKSFKEYRNFTSLKGQGKFREEAVGHAAQYAGKEILFEFTQEDTVPFLGATIDCYALLAIFGAAIGEITTPQNEETGDFLILLKPVPEKRMFISVRYFASLEELDAFRSDGHHTTAMRDATELTEP